MTSCMLCSKENQREERGRGRKNIMDAELREWYQESNFKNYIPTHQNHFKQFVHCRPIMDMVQEGEKLL